MFYVFFFFFFQAEDGIRDVAVTGVQTCALPIFLFLGWTKLGKAIRATSQSREVAMVCGIDVQRIHLVTFGLASALAAAGGALIAVIVAIQPEIDRKSGV